MKMTPQKSTRPKRLICDVSEAQELHGDAHHYATRVLRLTIGDELELCDGIGTVQRIQIENINKRVLSYAVLETSFEKLPTQVLTLITAIPKGERLDWMLQKLTELGAARIVLTPFEHSVAKLKASSPKVGRLQKIVDAACAQCRRAHRPELVVAEAFDDLLKYKSQNNAVAHWQKNRGPTIQPALSHSIVVGPEGGFQKRELEILGEEGFNTLHLGPYILRTETAAIAAAARFNGEY